MTASALTASIEDDRLAARSEMRLMLAGALLYVAGSAIFYMIPAYLAFVGGRLSLGPDQLGTLAAAESLAIAITSLLGPFWIARIDRRVAVMIGASACIAGNLAIAFAPSFDLVLASRVFTGLLGEGVLFTTSFAVLGAARNIDRAFAIGLTAAAMFGALVTAAASMLERMTPGVGPMGPLAVVALAIFPFVGWLSPRENSEPAALAPPSTKRRVWNWVAIIGLFAQGFWFAAPGAFWTFVEQVATDKGLPTPTAEFAISIGELAGLGGCIVAAWQGDRLGRMGPIIGATLGLILPAVAYQLCDGAFGLGLFLSLFYCFWNYGCVYQMSFVSGLDASGRAAVMMPAAQVFGLSFGPYCAGELIVTHGDAAVTVSTVAFAAIGLALYLVCFARVRGAALA